MRKVCAKEYIETETETILKLKDEEIEHLRKSHVAAERKNDLLKFVLVILVVVVIKLALPY